MPKRSPVRLRRARTVLVYWKQGQLIFENYRTRVSVSADPVVARILHLCDQWRRPEQLVRAIPEYSPRSLRRTLRQLTAHNLLVKEGTPDAAQDARLAKVWAHWLPYGSLHFATKDVRFIGERQRWRIAKRYLTESHQPAFFKRYPKAPRVRLERFAAPSEEFFRVLLARRTHRQFSGGTITRDVLSRLLYYTWAVTGYVETPFGRLAHKTSPSGGARHPVEVYVLALKVRGLPPGVYHYDAKNHCLELLRKGRVAERAAAYCADRSFVKRAAALFLMTAVFPRSMWKYRFARAYRIVTLDAGHLCQTFCLTATYLGLAPFSTAALQDTRIEKDLGIDGIEESVIYAAGVGIPRRGIQRG